MENVIRASNNNSELTFKILILTISHIAGINKTIAKNVFAISTELKYLFASSDFFLCNSIIINRLAIEFSAVVMTCI